MSDFLCVYNFTIKQSHENYIQQPSCKSVEVDLKLMWPFEAYVCSNEGRSKSEPYKHINFVYVYVFFLKANKRE